MKNRFGLHAAVVFATIMHMFDPCSATDCVVGEWSEWSSCSVTCGRGETRRSREKTVAECCGGSCRFPLEETMPCNLFCYNDGTPLNSSCICHSGGSGKCCESSLDASYTSQDPCDSNGHFLLNDPKRSVGYKMAPSTPYPVGDRLLQRGWYRFISEGGGEMPTFCPPQHSCGARGSIWLNDSNPTTVNEIKTVQACARVGSFCCSISWNAQVKKCQRNNSEYFVYFLEPAAVLNLVYCEGKELKCPDGNTSSSGLTAGCSDPCDSGWHVTINDPQRSTGFKVGPGSLGKAGDQSLQDVWYRFVSWAGGEMPTSCPAEYACGSSSPVWLNGSNPTSVNEIKVITACARIGEHCCGSTWNVQVKKCKRNNSEYFIYNLVPTPFSHNVYCAGKEVKCLDGENSAVGLTPGCSDPCDSDRHLLLNDPQRNVNFKMAPSSRYPEGDRSLQNSWYRFVSEAGGEMPTSCPTQHSCGARGSIWLNGSNPTSVNETKIVQACARVGGSCCSSFWDVKVRKCERNNSEYFVYYLVAAPFENFVYCEGKEVKCVEGNTSSANLTPRCSDPCDSDWHVRINDPQRSIGFRAAPGTLDRATDLWLHDAWYRFVSGAGGEMPTFCPAEHSCGLGPIWLNGSNPTSVNEIKVIPACARIGEHCCGSSWNVQVKKCERNNSEYFIYNLVPAPVDNLYCAGKEVRCHYGETSATGFTPCYDEFPKLVDDPKVSVGVSNMRLQFKCDFDVESPDARMGYEVTWYSGDPEKRLDKTDLLSGNSTASFLQNSNIRGEAPLFCLGEKIYCKVRTYFKDKENVKSHYYRSNEFFAGLMITPENVDLSEKDKPKIINITSTVPIVCRDGTESCEVLVEMVHDGTDILIDYCTVRLSPGPAGQWKELQVVAKRDFVNDGDKHMVLKFHLRDRSAVVDWNCHKNITSVEISTRNVKTSRCSSVGDPHLLTFDGFAYDHYRVGDYVLVKSTSRKFEVHVRTFPCHTVSCICGFAAQEGDDVVVVDMCQDNIPRARFASEVEPQPGTTLQRDASGKSFLVSFPSGSFIRFEALHWFGDWHYANLIVQVPSDDFNATMGLCGTFDDSSENDSLAMNGVQFGTAKDINGLGKTEFTESWKLAPNTSLFYYEGGPRRCLSTDIKKYCTCVAQCCDGKPKVDCDFQGYADRQVYEQSYEGWISLVSPSAELCRKRIRRDISAGFVVLPDDGNTGAYEYRVDDKEGTIPGWPTPSGKTESIVKNYCLTAIRESGPGKACFAAFGSSFDFAPFVEQCVDDVQITDDFTFAKSAISAMSGSCEELALKEPAFWTRDSTGAAQPPAAIGNTLCPIECSGNGVCINAKCVCKADYISADCSIKKGEPPVVKGIPFGGLCDIRTRDCVRTRVKGAKFTESNALVCRMTEVELSNNPYKKITSRTTTEVADMLSFAEISCRLPYVPLKINGDPSKSTGKATGGFAISVANNGITFSDDMLFLVYDSKCMSCSSDGQGICFWKIESCKISEYCFAKGDPDPRDWCQVCDPAQTRTGFVKRTDNKRPFFTPNSPMQHTFKMQKWTFNLPAFDPENQPLKYEFVGDSHDMGISSDGVLTWTPSNLGQYGFTVKVTDVCGLSEQAAFVVNVSKCICEGKNGGICKWDGDPAGSGVVVCVCPDGCTGTECTQAIDGRICRIRIPGARVKSWTRMKTIVVAVIVTFVVLAAIAAVVIFWLRKHNQALNRKSFKESAPSSNAGYQDVEIAKGGIVTQKVHDYELRDRAVRQ